MKFSRGLIDEFNIYVRGACHKNPIGHMVIDDSVLKASSKTNPNLNLSQAITYNRIKEENAFFKNPQLCKSYLNRIRALRLRIEKNGGTPEQLQKLDELEQNFNKDLGRVITSKMSHKDFVFEIDDKGEI